MKLRPYQTDLKSRVLSAWKSGARNVLAVMPTGAGKCLGKGTPVIMFDGSIKNVEDIKVGDLLLGPDSSPRRVESLARGREMLYKVVPVKGDSFIVNESHILSFKETGTERVKNVDVLDYLSRSNNWKHTHKAWRASVDFPKKTYSKNLSPYFLGLWLGDGSADAAEITTADREIVEYIYNFAKETGQNVRLSPDHRSKSDTYALSKNYQRDGTLSELRAVGVYRNKHIPLSYKTGSKDQRLELLAGIIDSDGHYDGKTVDILFKSKQLAGDVAYLARSLGFAAYPKQFHKKCYNTGAVGVYYRMTISGDFSILPTLLDRNKYQKRRQKKDVLKTGISVEKIGIGEYFGFSLSGPDRLFLLGDFTVTHNTATFSDIMHTHDGPSVAIAHRQELVSQISLALARNGVRHRIIGPHNVVKLCVNQHMAKLGRSYYDPSARSAVAGVDTLVRRGEGLDHWARSVSLWVTDEAHHPVRGNKWATAAELFPNARGLGVTATPTRADGKGLGRDSDGIFDEMVEGPGMRELINAGYLTDYRIFAPPTDFVRPQEVAGSGDFSPAKMTQAVRDSHIVGDIVGHYKRIAPGKLGVTFVPDVDTARMVAEQFNAAGVPAEVVSAKTPDADRVAILGRFERRELLQLVNVDLFGEGFDLPAIEVVSFGRPTESLSLYIQQFGRVLRLMVGQTSRPWDEYSDAERRALIAASSKPAGIIIDHVGNVARHGLPDARREWSLDRRERRSSSRAPNVIPVWTCLECAGVWERIYTTCLSCGAPRPAPQARSAPEFVDGDLLELSPETLAALRAQVANVDKDPEVYRAELAATGLPAIAQMANVKKLHAKQAAQRSLRDAIAWWAGYQRAAGRDDSESYRRFYFAFGVDVLTAQTLGTREAEALAARVNDHISRGL